MNSEQIDPFRDQIVSDARARNLTVRGLNERPLHLLRERFAELTAATPPRLLRSARPALLVSSDEPGYGKSHLISRLFSELHGQASLVYVQPFQNARTPFYSVTLALVRELHFPDVREASGAWDRDAPSQLDQLAHAVLAHAVADLIEGAVPGFEIDTDASTAQAMRADPMGAFQRGQNSWAAWLQEYWRKLDKGFEPAMAKRGLRLHHPDAWLRVLRAYAFAPFDTLTRRICTEWMCAQPIDADEAARVGLRPIETIGADISPDDMERICRERLHDLCELSSYFRPLVFSFDQTEMYGDSPRLARVFGTVIATLVNEMRGHLVLITANAVPWRDRMAPHMEDADRQRIEKPYVTLEGVNREQAAELVRLRMSDAGVDGAEVTRFLERPWFGEIFTSEKTQMGARTFLQKCKEAWSGVAEAPSLELLFAERRDKILASPKRHVLEPATLQWLVETAAGGLPGIEIAPVAEDYATVQWKGSERDCFFGFLTGSNWAQWGAVARASAACQGSSAKPCKFIYFRVVGQPAVPGAAWQGRAAQARTEIAEAQKSTLQLVQLSIEELAELYAPRDLYADAAQGDIPFSTEEVIAFVQQRLARFWQRLRGPVEVTVVPDAAPPPAAEDNGGIPQPSPLAAEVCRIVEAKRFLSMDELLSALGPAKVTREAALEAVGFCGDIRLHTHPKMTVLQWQPRG